MTGIVKGNYWSDFVNKLRIYYIYESFMNGISDQGKLSTLPVYYKLKLKKLQEAVLN